MSNQIDNSLPEEDAPFILRTPTGRYYLHGEPVEIEIAKGIYQQVMRRERETETHVVIEYVPREQE